MLFRILGIATMSVTFLTIQAMNSTETKSQRASTSLKLSAEVVILDKPDASTTLHRIKSPSGGLTASLQNEKDTAANNPQTFNPIYPKIVLASIGEIPLVLPKVKFKLRPSYLPPIDLNETPESLSDDGETTITASIDSKPVIESKPPKKAAKKITAPKRVYKKYKRKKKYGKRKYKKKYNKKWSKRKYNKRKQYRKARYKRKYKKRYAAKKRHISGFPYGAY